VAIRSGWLDRVYVLPTFFNRRAFARGFGRVGSTRSPDGFEFPFAIWATDWGKPGPWKAGCSGGIDATLGIEPFWRLSPFIDAWLRIWELSLWVRDGLALWRHLLGRAVFFGSLSHRAASFDVGLKPDQGSGPTRWGKGQLTSERAWRCRVRAGS
jgi:hypothetical protein